MKDLKKLRRVLWIALGVAGALAFGLRVYPFEGWALWVARGGMAFDAAFALAVGVLLLVACFPTENDDLWGTPYFCYMRDVWGFSWGGSGYPGKPLHFSLSGSMA